VELKVKNAMRLRTSFLIIKFLISKNDLSKILVVGKNVRRLAIN